MCQNSDSSDSSQPKMSRRDPQAPQDVQYEMPEFRNAEPGRCGLLYRQLWAVDFGKNSLRRCVLLEVPPTIPNKPMHHTPETNMDPENGTRKECTVRSQWYFSIQTSGFQGPCEISARSDPLWGMANSVQGSVPPAWQHGFIIGCLTLHPELS